MPTRPRVLPARPAVAPYQFIGRLGRGAGVGRGLGVAFGRAVGVGLAVAVGVGVGVTQLTDSIRCNYLRRDLEVERVVLNALSVWSPKPLGATPRPPAILLPSSSAAFAEATAPKGEADPPWAISRDEAVPASTTKPAAMNKKTQSMRRSRSDPETCFKLVVTVNPNKIYLWMRQRRGTGPRGWRRSTPWRWRRAGRAHPLAPGHVKAVDAPTFVTATVIASHPPSKPAL